ncbi:MAG: hypothetical protein L6R41_001055 [Letrouitia leprolyta]|nr:MAG: hypothetical protein L6R41_001055 [Letrouitia leprolyta]
MEGVEEVIEGPPMSETKSARNSGLQDEDQSTDPPERRLSPSQSYDSEVSMYQVPREILTNEAGHDEKVQSFPNDRYFEYLHLLCQETGTADLEHHCTAIFDDMVLRAQSLALSLHESLETKPELDVFAYAFVIYTWQVVCLKRFHGTYPQDGEYLHERWASYYLAAYSLLCTTVDFEPGYLRFASLHWENRFFAISSNRSWVQEEWLDPISMLNPDEPCYRNDQASEYLTVLEEHGVAELIRRLLTQEAELQQTPLQDMPDDESEKTILFRSLILIFLSIEDDLLKAIIQGQVARLGQHPMSKVGSLLMEMRTCQDQPPAIYMNSLCDHEGISPTPFQWRIVCDIMRLYVEGDQESDELATVLDQLIHPTSNWPKPIRARDKKFHRYTEWKTWSIDESDVVCDHRRTNIRLFVENMEQRLDREVETTGEHTPLTAPVVEVGFSGNAIARLADHRKHRNSNYIMNLAQAAFEYKYPNMFHLNQHIIYHCWRETQPWDSEILLTRLAQGYIHNAGGFSHHGAGLSNFSSWKDLPMEVWESLEERIASTPGFKRRAQQERDRVTLAREAAEERRVRREVARLNLERIKALTELVDATTRVVEYENRLIGRR